MGDGQLAKCKIANGDPPNAQDACTGRGNASGLDASQRIALGLDAALDLDGAGDAVELATQEPGSIFKRRDVDGYFSAESEQRVGLWLGSTISVVRMVWSGTESNDERALSRSVPKEIANARRRTPSFSVVLFGMKTDRNVGHLARTDTRE